MVTSNIADYGSEEDIRRDSYGAAVPEYKRRDAALITGTIAHAYEAAQGDRAKAGAAIRRKVLVTVREAAAAIEDGCDDARGKLLLDRARRLLTGACRVEGSEWKPEDAGA